MRSQRVGHNWATFTSLQPSLWSYLVAQSIKNLPAIQETQVQSLGQEDYTGEGHGNPLQYSCLENPMDWRAWRATVHRVTNSQTWLKWLSMHKVTICSDFRTQENKIHHCFQLFPFYLPWSNRTRCHDFIFWMFSFNPAYSLSSFTLIKRLFSSSLYAISMISSEYLRLLIFMLANMTEACDSPSMAFHSMYSAWKLNKQEDSIQSSLIPFPIWTSPLFHVWF